MKIILRFRLSANQSITMRSPCANELIRSARSRISNPTHGFVIPTRVKISHFESSDGNLFLKEHEFEDILKMETNVVFSYQVLLMLMNIILRIY